MTTSSHEATAFDLPAVPTSPVGRRTIDPRRFWVGSALSAAIAAMVALVALVIAHGLLHIPVLVPDDGRLVAVGFGAYCLLAAAIAVVASALYTVILHFAPRPRLYFGWIAALGTALAVLLPLTTGAALVDQLALATTNFVVGMVITFLVPVAAARAR
ncbi:DUF6069 family protein [Microlunatus ginsengisoli]|uniref:Uncharacterized protein n=1 Tax=Microlunatus ginsengisoli TaxID=363863 RepID=A0ABP6ZBM7_9ACTN